MQIIFKRGLKTAWFGFDVTLDRTEFDKEGMINLIKDLNDIVDKFKKKLD